jgi:hypothetical protein
MIAAAFAGGVTPDPYFEYTTLLLPGNGTNGATNNAFLDSSTANSGSGWGITRTGNTTQGTFSPFSQTGWGNYFGGGASNINLPSSTDFALGGAFSFECWVYQASIPNQVDLLDVRTSNEVGSLGISSTGFPRWQTGPTTGSLITGSTALTANQWNYLLFVADASGCSIYLNGTRGANTSQVATWPTSARPCFIAGSFANASGGSLNGYVSDVRLIKGSTPYSSTATTVTVPTEFLPFVTNTVLQCCKSNRFVNTVSGTSMTTNGTTSVQAFSPFNPTASWSAATYGGSGYFDGSTDYLNVTSPTFTLGTSNLTAECWFYPTAAGNSSTILACKISGGAGFYFVWASTTNAFRLLVNAGAVWSVDASTSALNLNSWNHLVMTRDGTTIRTFLNGVLATVSTGISGSMGATAPIVKVGADDAGSGVVNACYITNTRIIVGSVFAAYQTSSTTTGTQIFTPPTAPLTNATDTKLLLNFTNAGVYDATSKNDLETVDTTQISTAINNPFGSGTGVISFDGTGDYIQLIASQNFNLGTGDFTIEAWIYPTQTSCSIFTMTASGVNQFVFTNNINPATGGSSNGTAQLWMSTGAGTGIFAPTNAVTQNAWNYVAAVRQSGTVTVYVNGSAGTPVSNTTNVTGVYAPRIGALYSHSASATPACYISNLRITKYARTITASPIAAFPTL